MPRFVDEVENRGRGIADDLETMGESPWYRQAGASASAKVELEHAAEVRRIAAYVDAYVVNFAGNAREELGLRMTLLPIFAGWKPALPGLRGRYARRVTNLKRDWAICVATTAIFTLIFASCCTDRFWPPSKVKTT